MKRLLLSAVLSLPYFLYSQTPKDSLVTFAGVVNVDSTSKEQLFIRARQWFNAVFKDARNAIRIADKETGELLAKGVIDSYHWYKALGKEYKVPISYDVELAVMVKDGKYKYEFKNFCDAEKSVIKYGGPLFVSQEYPIKKSYRSKDIMDKIWQSMPVYLDTTMQVHLSGLKQYMAKPVDDF